MPEVGIAMAPSRSSVFSLTGSPFVVFIRKLFVASSKLFLSRLFHPLLSCQVFIYKQTVFVLIRRFLIRLLVYSQFLAKSCLISIPCLLALVVAPILI